MTASVTNLRAWKRERAVGEGAPRLVAAPVDVGAARPGYVPPWRRDRIGKLAAGDVVGCVVLGVVHEGIVTDTMVDGRPTVVHASARVGAVAEEPWREFVGPYRAWRIGYYGDRCACCVVRDARLRIGEPYDLLLANCQHLTRSVHGVAVRSPGLIGAALAGVSLAVGGAVLAAHSTIGARK